MTRPPLVGAFSIEREGRQGARRPVPMALRLRPVSCHDVHVGINGAELLFRLVERFGQLVAFHEQPILT
jgi:hypothetical protein